MLKALETTMQITFFTSPEDEFLLIDFIETKSGYFICDRFSLNEKGAPLPVLQKNDINELPRYRDIEILSHDILPVTTGFIGVQDLRDKRGFPKVEYIEFTRSYSSGGVFYPGRLWLNGLKPQTEKLYKSLASFIRRKFTNIDGWYWSKNAQCHLSANCLEKANATH
jgi:hypothetical protein